MCLKAGKTGAKNDAWQFETGGYSDMAPLHRRIYRSGIWESCQMTYLNQVIQTDPLLEHLGSEPVASYRDSPNGALKAVWLPSEELFSNPASLRHVPSTVLIHSTSGQFWVVSMMNLAWNASLIAQVEKYLHERFGTCSWQQLEGGLSEAVELKLVLHQVCLVDEQLSLLEIPRLADAIFRRWITSQSTSPEVAALRQLKEALILEIRRSANVAVSQLLNQLNPEIVSLANGPLGMRLDMYSYLAQVRHQKARLQFVKAFPLLADLVCASEMKLFGIELGRTVDALKSPVIFLQKELAISASAVRALNGVRSADVGCHFCSHPQELLTLLNAIPKEFLPKTPEHWQVLQHQYEITKQFFGRSPAASVLLKARLAHSLRFTVQFDCPDAQLNEDDLPRVQRLRTGLVQASYSHFGIERNHSLSIHRRAKINQLVDQFLGGLSWSRLLAISKKFDKSYAEAVERNLDAVRFISGQTYFDFCPDGKYVTPAEWSVRCLLNSAELKAHGQQLAVCLATPGHRAIYHDECYLGRTAVFAIHDQHMKPKSTVEMQLSVVKFANNETRIRFYLVQHKGYKNSSVDGETLVAFEAFQSQIASAAWQAHARNGIRFSHLRGSYSNQNAGVSAAQFVNCLLAFRTTFKDKADKLLQQLSGESD